MNTLMRQQAIDDFNSKLEVLGLNSFRLQVGDDDGNNAEVIFIKSNKINNTDIEGFLKNSILKPQTSANLISIGFKKVGIIENGVISSKSHFLRPYDMNKIIESLNTISEAIEMLFDTVVLRKIFIPVKCAGKPIDCFVFVPISSNGFIMNRQLEDTENTSKDIINTFYEKLKYDMYDGGLIRMSYILTDETDAETLYSSSDTPIIPNIYEKLGSVAYCKIGFQLI